MGQDSIKIFSGSFERVVDAKKRVSVPASWLCQDEGEVFHVVPHPVEDYLMVMRPDEFDRWEQRILESDKTPQEKRMAIRKFYSEANSVSTDKQGRILLSDKHCERAGLVGEVVFVAGRSRFEIWSKERYGQADLAATEAYKSVADSIGL